MKYVGRPKQLVRRSALALAGAAVFTIPALGLVAVGPAQALADEALSQPAALTAPALAGAAQDQEQAQGESQAQTQAESQARAESQAQPQAQDQAQAAESQAQAQPDVQAEPDAQPQLAARAQAPVAEAPGWHSGQGGTYYVDPDGTRHTGWLVTDTYESYGLQRYWMGADGVLRTSSLVDAADAGWWAYARPEGYVVRGKWVDSSSGLVYLADNDGRLEDPGWVVTGSYGGGLQRYWVDASSHAAEPGYSQDGWNHYTLADGYVLRGAAEEGGEKWLADNDGLLASGWAVTSAFGGGLQRYWFGADGRLVCGGLVSPERAGWWACARPEGYVVRGKWRDPETGLVYLADNDGRLADPGWHVTSAYGGGLQRYWVDASAHAAVPGYSADGWAHYTLSDGTVLRGALSSASGKWLADNDGRLVSGWVVTDALGDGFQRYWFGADGRLVRGGLVSPSRAGFWAYARPEGYVVRGKWRDPETGLVYLADNDGRLEDPGWVVTDSYGGGLQRYWVDASAHAAVPGYSADGWAHYTLPDTGFVARNTTVTVSGKNYYADNDGLLSEITGMNGIDIASWQAGIDISALSNTTFVIVKVSEGNYYTNPYWEQWADEVVASGKKLGLYHYAGGTSSADAQAQFFLDRVAKYIGKAVVVLDWEETSNPQFGSGADPTFAQAWTRYVEDKTGVTPWVYVSYGVAKNYSDLGCPLWVAKYAYKYYSDSGEIMTGYVDDPAFEDQVREIGNVVCYQYTSCGGVDGYGKAVDINKFYGAPEDWDKYARATRA